MSDTTDRLRKVAEAADNEERWQWDQSSVYLPEADESVCEDKFMLSSSAEHIATFDPVLVAAMLDVIDAADRMLSRSSNLNRSLARFREVAGE